jgi:ring-1,2-phenylacetyl-CoA epoxidase subunit PaaE
MSSNAIEIVGETATSASHFYPLAVRSIRRETRDAVEVTFDVPETLKDRFRFVQGQFVTLKAVIDGEEVRRSYSICSAVQDGTLQVGIKRARGGLFSNWVVNHLRPGEVLDVAPPEGRFHLPLSPENKKQYVAFAAGSGITPVLSVLKTTLLAEPKSSFTLFYANRASSSIMFREELAELKDRFLGRFNLVHVMTREHQDAEMLNGRIDADKAEQLMRTFCDLDQIDAVFLCGPQQMVDAIKARLKATGLAENRIKVELFATQTSERDPRRASSSQTDRECHVTLLLDGARHSFSMNRNQTVLDAALEHDIDVRHSCRSGVCATCRAKLVAGQVDMDANYALEDYEIARGFILTCQSFPVTDEISVDYDQDN